MNRLTSTFIAAIEAWARRELEDFDDPEIVAFHSQLCLNDYCDLNGSIREKVAEEVAIYYGETSDDVG